MELLSLYYSRLLSTNLSPSTNFYGASFCSLKSVAPSDFDWHIQPRKVCIGT